MRDFLAKFVPPLSPSQVEEIAAEHERLILLARKEVYAEHAAKQQAEKKKGK